MCVFFFKKKLKEKTKKVKPFRSFNLQLLTLLTKAKLQLLCILLGDGAMTNLMDSGHSRTSCCFRTCCHIASSCSKV